MVNYGYQGTFSEEVSEFELNYNEFQLRTYDPQIGRWTTPDPYDEFASPYLGMGNDPASNVDPSGGSILSGIWSFFGGGGSSAASSALKQVACPGTTSLFKIVVTLQTSISYFLLGAGGAAHAINENVGGSLDGMGGQSNNNSDLMSLGVVNSGDGLNNNLNSNLTTNTSDPESPDEPPINKPFNYLTRKTIYQTELQTFYESKRSWGGVKFATAATITLAADDVTAVGVVDDIAIPFIWIGALAYDVFSKPVAIPVVRPIVVPRVITIPVPAPLMYVSYTKYNPSTGQVYVGRTSGYGDPSMLVKMRDYGHKDKDIEGFLPALLDRALPATLPYDARQLDPMYQAIRGREQLYIDHLKGPQSIKCRNEINGISPLNPMRNTYLTMGKTLGGFLY